MSQWGMNPSLPRLGLTAGTEQKRVVNILLSGNTQIICQAKMTQCTVNNRIQWAITSNPDPLSADHCHTVAESLEAPKNANIESIHVAAGDIIKWIMPRNALARVKRHLWREFRKPAHTCVCEHCQHLGFINTQEVPWIPPCTPNQAFIDGELVNVMPLATPQDWQHEMDQMGIDPLTCSSLELLCQMENCKAADLHEDVITGWRNLDGNTCDALHQIKSNQIKSQG
jgi:hypothetical protein